MKLEGLLRSSGLHKMAYDRTVGLMIRNLCHFLERCEAGRKETELSLFSQQRGELVWDEEIVWFPWEVCRNEALELLSLSHRISVLI